MIYGNVFLPENVVEKKNTDLFVLESVVYNEYTNYNNLLESCTDDNARPILEAQVKVLYELSFNDIVEKIKSAWKTFKIKIVRIIDSILESIGSFIKSEKNKIRYEAFSKKVSMISRKWYFITKGDESSYDLLNEIKDKVADHRPFVINVEYDGNTEKIDESDMFNLRSKIDSTFKPFMDIYEDYLQEFLAQKENVSTDKVEKVKKAKGILLDFKVSVSKEDPKKENLNIENVKGYINNQVDIYKKICDLRQEDVRYYNNMTREIKKSINNISKGVSSLDSISKSEDGVEVVKTHADHLLLQMNYLHSFAKKLQIMATAMVGVYEYKLKFAYDLIATTAKIMDKYYDDTETDKSEKTEERGATA